ncbi:MAG: WxcM-like domain-containing protein [Syntrophomonadaceae bacterium]|nr:WxcM-like domain-containing protein [Syntrophomonadaceae bacterium]
MEPVLYPLRKIENAHGSLTAIEGLRDIPFEIKRVYYIYAVAEGARRGFHAHHELRQVLICVHGSCKVLLDDGVTKAVVVLEDPGQGLYIGRMVWREMFDFSPDAVLLVLASDYYDEEDYIRSYDEFLSECGKQGDLID